MKPLKFSPSIGISVFFASALILGALYCYFLLEEVGTADEELVAAHLSKGPDDFPIFAYWISGTGGEGRKMLRLLKAVYHPRNRYLLHLDAGCSYVERSNLLHSVRSERVFRTFRNVEVVGQSYAVDRAGPSAVAATLHGAAVLLRLYTDWDWFITLSASDYPLVTQDDLLHVFTSLPRNLNFIDHTSDLGWKEYERFDKIIVDPNLYMNKTEDLVSSTGVRKTPDAFKLFIGSPWVILSRPFVEHCVHGSDNFPRKLLLYFANVVFSTESYFQTLICNSPDFRNTTINNDLRYFAWDDPPGLEPLFLNKTHFKAMIKSRAAFARKFVEDDPLLNKVDEKLLGYTPSEGGFGQWCSGHSTMNNVEEDPCLSSDNINLVRPSTSAMRLKSLVTELISLERLNSNQCKF
ncbi:beta-glucuronosyltransferase GlcAT14A-like [Canna indica]|uniref:Beta-glucuronosyltransferase GlcAT14A-like n=1 Tax=Canna indica TaxID=4628 RepID=A0AAQ3K2R9_9LILI|nr:beta-glucuronosyltransferase GlcAT14A-like [Canna indica]